MGNKKKEDIDKLELAVKAIKGLVDVGEKIMADGKVDFKDIIHVKPLIDESINMAKAIKAYKEIGDEIKDIDGVEAVRLITLIFGK